VCDVITHPERAAECAFLLDTPEVSDGTAGAAGQASSSSSGASAGQAAAGDSAQAGANAE